MTETKKRISVGTPRHGRMQVCELVMCVSALQEEGLD